MKNKITLDLPDHFANPANVQEEFLEFIRKNLGMSSIVVEVYNSLEKRSIQFENFDELTQYLDDFQAQYPI